MKTKILITGLLCAAATATAEDLTTEITVERDVELILPKASPLPGVFPTMPVLPDSRMDIRPVQYNGTVAFDRLTGPDSLVLYSGVKAPDKRRGYLWAGYFPAYRLGAAAGYRIVDTDDSRVDASAIFNGYSYDSRTENYGKRTVSNNTVGIQASASHRFGNECSVWFDGSYRHAGLSAPSLSEEDQKRKIDALRLRLGTFGVKGLFDYRLKVGYTAMHLHKNTVKPTTSEPDAFFDPASDDRFKVDAALNLALNKSRVQNVGLDIGLDLLHRHGAYVISWSRGLDRPASPFIVSLTPSYTLSTESFKLRVGARFDIAHNTEGHDFSVAPDIKATWLPGAAFSAYLSLSGGKDFFTLTDLYNYSPFLPSNFASVSRSTPIDGRLGICVRPVGSLAIDIYGSYASVHRQTMLEKNYIVVSHPINIHGWSLGADITYSYDKYLEAKADVHLYPHSFHGASAEALDRAKFVLGASVRIKPLERLGIDLGYKLRTGRRYYEAHMQPSTPDGPPTIEYTAVGMGNISNLSLGASYAITPGFDVFARLENILCRHVLILPTIRTQGLHGLAGVSLRF